MDETALATQPAIEERETVCEDTTDRFMPAAGSPDGGGLDNARDAPGSFACAWLRWWRHRTRAQRHVHSGCESYPIPG